MEKRIVKVKDWYELCEACWKHNDENHITHQFEDKHPLVCYVVVKQMPYWTKEYTRDERTYTFVSSQKRFISGMCGNSVFADCVGDPNDRGVRLDHYLGDWQFEECWYEEEVA